MKIRMHGAYDHFPNHNPLPFEPYIDCYNDWQVKTYIEPNSIALMIEPRSLQLENYIWMEKNYNKFKYVFTHDSRLLKICPNAKLILWGGVSEFNDMPKTKLISMVSSNKEYCELHKARIELARRLKEQNLADVMGTVDGGEFVDTKTIYGPYRFSVAFENYIDDYWFTEKICNCFANKTIPIYYGAKKIDEFFNTNGIIKVKYWEEIPSLIENFDWNKICNIPYFQKAIEDNYERVKKFASFERWFFNEYEDLLDDIYSEAQRV